MLPELKLLLHIIFQAKLDLKHSDTDIRKDAKRFLKSDEYKEYKNLLLTYYDYSNEKKKI